MRVKIIILPNFPSRSLLSSWKLYRDSRETRLSDFLWQFDRAIFTTSRRMFGESLFEYANYYFFIPKAGKKINKRGSGIIEEANQFTEKVNLLLQDLSRLWSDRGRAKSSVGKTVNFSRPITSMILCHCWM